MASSRGPSRHAIERSRRPHEILEEAEQQWIYTEDELRRAPSVVDGLSVEDERTFRYKGYNFIAQVGIMLKLPQTTISSATVFFNRFLMRYSLKGRTKSDKPLHHYVRHGKTTSTTQITNSAQQVAATALFLATKVEEHCRKVRELVIACCRVAQKKPDLIVDENTKDYWRWRDTILNNEDVLLELLCFDLTIESPYNHLFSLLQYYGVDKQKKLRDSAWSFINDSNMTQACLLFTSRVIACAALYVGAKHTGISFSDDKEGRPWWETQRVRLRDVRKLCNYMADFYTNSPNGIKPGSESVYVGSRSPVDDVTSAQRTRLMREQAPATPIPTERSRSGSQASLKRGRDDDEAAKENGTAPKTNGHAPKTSGSRVPAAAHEEAREPKRPKVDSDPPPPPAPESQAAAINGAVNTDMEEGEASEEGEVEE
jgi:protein BUR2